MENEIYHKIRKYEQKLENEPTNNVYKYKLKYYYQMIGGLSENDLNSKIDKELYFSKGCFDADPKTIYEYIESIKKLDFEAKMNIYKVLRLNFDKFKDLKPRQICLCQLLIINDLYPQIDSTIITDRLDNNITLEEFKNKHIVNINRIKQTLNIPIYNNSNQKKIAKQQRRQQRYVTIDNNTKKIKNNFNQEFSIGDCFKLNGTDDALKTYKFDDLSFNNNKFNANISSYNTLNQQYDTVESIKEPLYYFRNAVKVQCLTQSREEKLRQLAARRKI
jgi:hypothetical protein